MYPVHMYCAFDSVLLLVPQQRGVLQVPFHRCGHEVLCGRLAPPRALREALGLGEHSARRALPQVRGPRNLAVLHKEIALGPRAVVVQERVLHAVRAKVVELGELRVPRHERVEPGPAVAQGPRVHDAVAERPDVVGVGLVHVHENHLNVVILQLLAQGKEDVQLFGERGSGTR